jgi:hypothetical protein
MKPTAPIKNLDISALLARGGLMMMRYTVLAVLLGVLVPQPARAQTKDQCMTLATSLPQAIVPMAEMEKAISSVKWIIITPHLPAR